MEGVESQKSLPSAGVHFRRRQTVSDYPHIVTLGASKAESGIMDSQSTIRMLIIEKRKI